MIVSLYGTLLLRMNFVASSRDILYVVYPWPYERRCRQLFIILTSKRTGRKARLSLFSPNHHPVLIVEQGLCVY